MYSSMKLVYITFKSLQELISQSSPIEALLKFAEINKDGGDILVSHKSGSSITMKENGDVVIISALGQKTRVL